MKLCRYRVSHEFHWGLVDGGQVLDLASAAQPIASLDTMLGLPRQEMIARLSRAREQLEPAFRLAELHVPPAAGRPHLVKPIEGQEIWCAGVTYYRSKEAREFESTSADAYSRVYEAERPELFFKGLANRCVGPYEAIVVRSDSNWSVPEPELTLLLNSRLETVGYTIGDDVSARDIEGENLLYPPQAKVWVGGCALGPTIALVDEVPDPRALEIEMVISRQGREVFRGTVATSKIRRELAELVEYLGRHNQFPAGVFLLTGVGIVPPDDFSLRDGDEVRITIEPIGTLTTPVSQAQGQCP